MTWRARDLSRVAPSTALCAAVGAEGRGDVTESVLKPQGRFTDVKVLHSFAKHRSPVVPPKALVDLSGLLSPRYSFLTCALNDRLL